MAKVKNTTVLSLVDVENLNARVTGDGIPLFSCFEEVGQFLRKLVFISPFSINPIHIYLPKRGEAIRFCGGFFVVIHGVIERFQPDNIVCSDTESTYELGTVLKHTYSFGG